MGFFSWFRRKPSGAPGEEATAGPVAAEAFTQDGPEPEETGREKDREKDQKKDREKDQGRDQGKEGSVGTAVAEDGEIAGEGGVDRVTESVSRTEGAKGERGSEPDADPTPASEAGIPTQQSAEVAAENEAGENARA
ncbi:hypothetical protein [Streptomyces sp. NPDC046887]|uniref:hypothetical protein n=1 Tax=Streptomyces sp. NPDC046887 TaxID=3155472 RepID=UPI0033D37DF7